ncbi:hypothetical protein SDC9_206319 [bioreactor metagenome]|uniref:DUF2802 domain-containing protein n=2 Tax=root TaxID=1 RepID=A0A645J665_9ZZZZ
MVCDMMNYINYLLTIVGIGMIIISLFLIASDKIRGERIYYDLYMKEQEIKKAIADAEEIVGELVYTSEVVISDIEEHISSMKQSYNNNEKEIGKLAADIDENRKPNKDVPVPAKTKKEKDILDLFSKGMNVDDIAKNLQIGKGEVSLTLSLNSGVKNNEII